MHHVNHINMFRKKNQVQKKYGSQNVNRSHVRWNPIGCDIKGLGDQGGYKSNILKNLEIFLKIF